MIDFFIAILLSIILSYYKQFKIKKEFIIFLNLFFIIMIYKYNISNKGNILLLFAMIILHLM